jgi:flagellar basal-body rod protein FlgB
MQGTEPVFQLLARALDAAALRQAVHTTNIANADVPGYRRLDVAFDDALAAALQTSDSSGANRPLADASELPAARIVPASTEAVRLDQEMALMAQNAVRYQALIGAFERAIGTLRLAVREGREV